VLAPQVRHFAQDNGCAWLVMDCLPGRNAAASDDSPILKIREIAAALRAIHALDPESCPFDESIGIKLARASARLKLGQVDEEDLEHETGKTPAELLRDVERLRPTTEDMVVTHGDACLENVMLLGGHFAGFIDCGRLGRSDRYQDLALACRSISEQIGAEWIGRFLGMCGVSSLDEERACFYRLLDEFF
jgi:aminoglycoside 3'-phosphotransferase II